jgi:predicted metal-binding membrane protein
MRMPSRFHHPFSRVNGLRPTTALDRGRLAILIILGVLVAVTWALTLHQAQTMDMAMGIVPLGAQSSEGGMGDMGDMAASGMTAGWSLSGGAAFLWAWAVMMAAMMFPAIGPMLLLFGRVHRQRRAGIPRPKSVPLLSQFRA